jgi:hypothetical protein
MTENKPPPKAKTDKNKKNDIDLSGKNPFQSPVFFLIILLIPIVSYIIMAVNTPPQTATIPPEAEAPATETKPIAAAKHRSEPKIKGSNDSCAFDELIGLPADNIAIEPIKAANRPYRILPSGSAMTMDMNTNRVNLDTDDQGIIRRVWCG